MPHLLIAGSTGTGKSVGLNCMIASILFRSTPAEVRLILIDPKRLELGVYEDIPHLLTPVVTDPKIASNVLKWAVTEMERRIRMLASEGVRNIEQFNNIIRAEKGGREDASGEELAPLHYIVIVIDELADLMMVSAHEVEESITRLAQMARAVGIHLILATQRPVGGRDHRPDQGQLPVAHLLPGGGARRQPHHPRLDRRRAAAGTRRHAVPAARQRAPDPRPRRLRHRARDRAAHGIPAQAGPAPSSTTPSASPRSRAEATELVDRDELFDDAVRFVVQSGQASTSMLQRRFRIGFSRAGRLVDMMERDGIVSPADGSKSREILVAQGLLRDGRRLAPMTLTRSPVRPPCSALAALACARGRGSTPRHVAPRRARDVPTPPSTARRSRPQRRLEASPQAARPSGRSGRRSSSGTASSSRATRAAATATTPCWRSAISTGRWRAAFRAPRYREDALDAYRSLVAEYPSSSLGENRPSSRPSRSRAPAATVASWRGGPRLPRHLPRGAHAPAGEDRCCASASPPRLCPRRRPRA